MKLSAFLPLSVFFQHMPFSPTAHYGGRIIAFLMSTHKGPHRSNIVYFMSEIDFLMMGVGCWEGGTFSKANRLPVNTFILSTGLSIHATRASKKQLHII